MATETEKNEARDETRAKVAFLKRRNIYPDRPAKVEAVETHTAWVFLTDRFVYKMKKPVRMDALDFTTLETRRESTAVEVRLNRRLAPDVYLGAVPLTLSAEGTYELGGPGVAIDWLVKMRRLPSDRMLDTMIERGTVTPEHVRSVAHVLASFYREAEPVFLTPAAYLQRLEDGIRACRMALHQSVYRVSRRQVERVVREQLRFVDEHADRIQRRARERRIVEGHGDLRPEHVCLLDPPVMFDCLEFDRQLRILDPVDELAFLGLECDRLGRKDLGALLLETYATLTGDRPDRALTSFYASYRACHRARIAVRHTVRVEPRNVEKWSERAQAYLELAEAYVASGSDAQ